MEKTIGIVEDLEVRGHVWARMVEKLGGRTDFCPHNTVPEIVEYYTDILNGSSNFWFQGFIVDIKLPGDEIGGLNFWSEMEKKFDQGKRLGKLLVVTARKDVKEEPISGFIKSREEYARVCNSENKEYRIPKVEWLLD